MPNRRMRDAQSSHRLLRSASRNRRAPTSCFLMRGFFLSDSLSSRRVTGKFLMPCHDRPVSWRLYPANPPVQFVEHFPTVCAQFLLDSCREIASDALRQRARLADIRPSAGRLPTPQLLAMVGAWVASLPRPPGPPLSGGTAVAVTAALLPTPAEGQCQGVPPDQCPAGGHLLVPMLPGRPA